MSDSGPFDWTAMFEEMLEGVQLLDGELRYRYVNAAAAAHGKRAREELVGRRMADMYPGVEQTEMYRRVLACLNERQPQQLENEFAYPDGTTRWFSLRMTPVPAGVLIMSIDITELKEIDRRRGELVVMLAHELRNPLAAVRNGIHIVRSRTPGDAGARHVADAMERQVRYLSRYVDDLLDLNRIATGKVALSLERIDLARLLRDTVEGASALFEEQKLSLEASIPSTPVWVHGDESRLAQVFGNVLDNARRFSTEGGHVHVALACADALATVTIRDGGCGIGADALPHVFEPLFQEDRSLHRTGGLGIGLALAQALIKRHDGDIRAESRGQGMGTTMTIDLPRMPEPRIVAAVPETADAGRDGRQVLLIEDNEDAASTLATILEHWGYQVRIAHSGPAGVQAAREASPDIVLCDIGLPGMDGFAVARALRSADDTRACRLIAVTGYGRDEDSARAREAGFDVHLAKPVNPDTLRQRMEMSTR